MLSYIEFLTYLFIKNKRILSSVMMIYNELRRSDGFILCNETKSPNPLETVGWGILIYLTSKIISVLFRFP